MTHDDRDEMPRATTKRKRTHAFSDDEDDEVEVVVKQPREIIDLTLDEEEEPAPAPVVAPTARPAPSSVLQFHSRAKPTEPPLPPSAGRDLSNFADIPVRVFGEHYPTAEHAFQAQKYISSNRPDVAAQFPALKDPLAAKRLGSRKGMDQYGAKLDFADWERRKDDVMRDIVHAKIEQNPGIQDTLRLAKQHNIRLSHFSRSDDVWGNAKNKQTKAPGQDRLGKLFNDYMDQRM